MRSSMVVGMGLMFLGLVLWFAVARDQWDVCRSLGHGRVYCFFAQGDHR